MPDHSTKVLGDLYSVPCVGKQVIGAALTPLLHSCRLLSCTSRLHTLVCPMLSQASYVGDRARGQAALHGTV